MAGSGITYEIEAPSSKYEVEAPDTPTPVASDYPKMSQVDFLGRQVPTLHIDPNAPVSTKVLNLNPGGENFEHAPTSYNEYERESGRDIGTVAGAMAGHGLIPDSWGAIGKYLIKPITSGVTAATGALTGGATPGEAATTGAATAGGEGFFGALGAGARGLLKTGILGDGMANYFADTGAGKFVPSDEMRDIQRVHQAMGIPPTQIKPAPGMTSAGDAYVMPARGVLKVTGLKPAEIEQMTPMEHGKVVNDALQKTGQAISKIVKDATDRGVKFDVGNSFTKAVGDLSGPTEAETDALQQRAIKIANDTAEKLGITDWRQATPQQALKLRQELWENFPPRYRKPLYGAITRDLKAAVPEIIPEDTNFQDLKGAQAGVTKSIQKSLSRATPSKFEELLQLLKQHPAIAGATGIGGSVSGAMGLYQGGKAAYDYLTKP